MANARAWREEVGVSVLPGRRVDRGERDDMVSI